MAEQSAPPSPPLLVGRERELATLHDALAAALAGRGSLVLIGGEAGIGKTALAEATLAEATSQGALVLVGRCYDLAETPPYGPWIDLFARYQPAAASPPLPSAFARRGTVGAVASQAELCEQVRDFLSVLAPARPVVVLLDDLHWSDPASLELLRALARGLADLPLLFVATYRADELTRGHPLYAALPALVREARAARLDLRPLDAAGVRAMLRHAYSLPPGDEARLAAYLHGRAEGNPFYAGELLRTLEGNGTLRSAGPGWRLGDLVAAGVPPLLRQVIDGRVDRLGERARQLLTVAAVVGQAVPFALWQAVAEVGEEALLDCVERAGEAGLVAESGEGMRFAHALIREALYEGLPSIRRRALHRRAAEALAATHAPDPDGVAYHFRQAGDERALVWLIRAGERARAAYAWETAVARFEHALALVDSTASGAEERGLIRYRLARMRRYADPRQALDDLGDVARIAEATGDRALAALALFCRGMTRIALRETAEGSAELAAGVEALQHLPREALARLDRYEGRRTWANAHGTLVADLAHVGRFAEALAIAARGAHDEPAGNAVGGSFLADLLAGLGQAHAALGRPDEAGRAFARARAAYRGVEHHLLISRTAMQEQLLVALAYRTEQLAERRQLAAEGVDALRRASGGVGATSVAPRAAALPLLVVEGDWDEARAIAADARTATVTTLLGQFVAPLLGQVARAQGDGTLARESVRTLLPDGPTTDPTWQPFYCALLCQRIAAALAIDAGDLPAARAWLEAHDHWLAWSGAVLGRAEGHLGWAAYQRAAGDRAAARERAARALAHATEPRQPLALLAAHRLLGELAPAGRHADAHAHLDAALALADACAAPYERALTLLAIAEWSLAADDRDGAQVRLVEACALLASLHASPALARADALAARLVAPAPAAPDRAGHPFGLTAREDEVLRLVAQGLTNAQVAGRLFVTPRTVNAHLTAIYGKLGVENRAAAVRRALDHGLR